MNASDASPAMRSPRPAEGVTGYRHLSDGDAYAREQAPGSDYADELRDGFAMKYGSSCAADPKAHGAGTGGSVSYL